MTEPIVTHGEREEILRAAFELLRAVLRDRTSPPLEIGVRMCVARGLLTVDRKSFPPLPALTPKGAMSLVALIDDFDRLTKQAPS